MTDRERVISNVNLRQRVDAALDAVWQRALEHAAQDGWVSVENLDALVRLLGVAIAVVLSGADVLLLLIEAETELDAGGHWRRSPFQ